MEIPNQPEKSGAIALSVPQESNWSDATLAAYDHDSRGFRELRRRFPTSRTTGCPHGAVPHAR